MRGPNVTEKRDFYELLELQTGASATEIKTAYRRLARKYHPDVNAGEAESEERFKAINEAYEVLSDPEKRERYDRFGHAGVNGGDGGFGAGMGPMDLFDLVFGTGRGGRAAYGPARGDDLRVDVEL